MLMVSGLRSQVSGAVQASGQRYQIVEADLQVRLK
jgi:hypothetical protein